MITSSIELASIVDELRRSGISMGTDALHYVTETESLIEQAYNGRSIFELIQNARDASQLKGEDGVIRFQLTDRVLSATNTGNPFSEAGIKAISRVGRSDKHSAETIGFKGLGFKSVRQLTDTPQVVTAYGSIQFDAEKTRQQYGSLGLDELPLFLLPYFEPEALSEEELAESVATRIELPLRDAEAEQWVYRNFQELNIRQLLFLGRIRELHFASSTLNKSFQLTTNGSFLEGQVTGQALQRFWLFTPEMGIVIPPEITSGLSKKEKAIVAAMKEADVRVALEVGADGKFKPVKEAPLHLFYPLKTLTGFRFLIHSYFLVNPERTALREDTKLNTFLLEQIGTFIGSTICEQLKEAEWDTCEVLYYVRQPQAELLPLYNSLQNALKQQAFIYFEGNYFKPEEVMSINPKLANGLPLQRVNEKQLVVVASPEIRKWLWEEFRVKELEAEALPATLEGACRSGLAAEDWGFFTELYQFLSTKDAPDMTGRAVLLTEHGALVASKNTEVFYLDNPQDALQLPASLQNQVQLLHSRFQFNGQLGFLQSKTGLRSYERASLAGALLREMGPQKLHNWEILRVLYSLRQVVIAVDFQRDGWLPTSAGAWVRPWARPLYMRSGELVHLYPQGRFLDESVFEQLDLNEKEAQQDFLSWAGVWQRPGLYVASDEQVVVPSQQRYKRIVSSGSPTIKLINDRLLDVPSRPTSWFSQLLLTKWPEYQSFIRQETGGRNTSLLYNNATRVVQQPQRSTWSGAVEWLQNQAWLWLEGDADPRRVRDVVIGPEGVSEADQLSLAYLPTLELPASVFYALNLDLDLVTWQAGTSSNFVRVLQLFYEHNATTALDKLSATGKAKLLKAYNRLLSRVYEYCANRNLYQLSGLEQTKFLAVDMVTQQLSWCNAMDIYYVDDRGLYDLLPPAIQARLQPQFTKTEPNQFGKIAKNYGVDISTVISVVVVAGQVQQEQTAWEVFGEILLDCISILDAKLADQLTEAEAHQLLRFPVWHVQELQTAFRWEEETEAAELLVDYAVGEDAARTIGLYLKQHFQIQHSLRASKALVSVFARLLPTKSVDWADIESTLTDYLELENKERFMKRHGDTQRRQELRYLLLGEDDRGPAAFWQAVRQAMGLPDLSEEIIRQAGIPELSADLGLPADRLAEFASERFRYEQLSASGNRKALQWLLRTLQLPLATLQAALGEQLNLEMLWGNEWVRLKRQYKPAFREWLYDRLQAVGNKAAGMQRQSYRYWLLSYDELSARPYPAELTENLVAHFRTKLQEMLPALAEAGELTLVGVRPEQWYTDNYRKALQQLQARVAREEQDWLAEFLQDSQRDSLLYFGEVALLAKQFETWAQSRRQVPPVEETDADPLQLFNNLANVYGGKFTMRATATSEATSGSTDGGGGTSAGYSVSGAATSSAHAETGCIAEQWVYAWLQQRYDSVRWTSYNAVSVGAAHPWYNPEGSDSLGYDLTYWDADLEEEIWVEVKSSTSTRLSFFISRKELAVAAQRGPHYKLFYVTQALSQEQARIYDLDNPFPDGIKSIVENPHFVAEWEKVRISFSGTAETPSPVK